MPHQKFLKKNQRGIRMNEVMGAEPAKSQQEMLKSAEGMIDAANRFAVLSSEREAILFENERQYHAERMRILNMKTENCFLEKQYWTKMLASIKEDKGVIDNG